MTTTLTRAPEGPPPPLPPTSEATINPSEREEVLRKLFTLGADYEYARDSGLLDMFYYDSETGKDSLIHVLAGEKSKLADGTPLNGGFHHERSGEVVWGSDEQGNLVTYVDRSHLDGANSRKKNKYNRHRFEPYRARVVVGQGKKVGLVKDEKTGEVVEAELPNNMFPQEYDALAVLQAVRQALDNRQDPSEDEISNLSGDIISKGEAYMLDGKNKMEVRLYLDPATGKVKSAHPLVNGGKMKLTEEDETRYIKTPAGLIVNGQLIE